jgi:hypothetical protein
MRKIFVIASLEKNADNRGPLGRGIAEAQHLTLGEPSYRIVAPQDLIPYMLRPAVRRLTILMLPRAGISSRQPFRPSAKRP